MQRRSFVTSIRNVASERDFNRIESADHKPDALEQALSGFESTVYEAIQRISAARNLDDENDRTIVLNLLALIHQRHPVRRATIDKFMGNIWKDMLRLTVQTPERWEEARKAVRDELAAEGLDDITYEQAKKFVDDDEYDVSTNREYHIGMEFEVFDEILPIYFQRKWMLCRAADNTGGFITSDQPVCLAWSKPGIGGPLHPPGLGHKSTMLLFPLTRQLCLMGTFDGEAKAVDLNFRGVARINARIIRHAHRQVYAAHDKFLFFSENNPLPHFGHELAKPKRRVTRRERRSVS